MPDLTDKQTSDLESELVDLDKLLQRLEDERGINVRTLLRKTRVHLASLSGQPLAGGRLTRFGRATLTKVYA